MTAPRTRDQTRDPRPSQRRGQVVIVSMIVVFVLVCAALGVFLWQRQQSEDQLAELSAPGLTAVAVPQWGPTVADATPLASNRGLQITYADADGEPVAHLRAINLRVLGQDPDLCQLLSRAEPTLADDCTAADGQLSASGGPDGSVRAEGQRLEGTLLVLVADADQATTEQLRERVADAELISVKDLLRLID